MVKLYYQKHQCLDTSYRSILSKILIHKEFEQQNYPQNFKITTERFLEFRKQITLLFPKEDEFQTIYYFPYDKNTNRTSSGKLWDSYNHFKSKLNKLKTNVKENTAGILTEISTDCKEKLDYLYKNISDFDKIKQYWKETYEQRKSFHCENISIENYMKKFPILNTNKGSLLLLQDFDILYTDNVNKLFAYWDVFDKKLVKIAESRIKKVANESGSTSEFLSQPKKHITEILKLHCDFRGILLLPHLLNKSSYTKGVKRKRLSTKEIEDSFVHLISVSFY